MFLRIDHRYLQALYLTGIGDGKVLPVDATTRWKVLKGLKGAVVQAVYRQSQVKLKTFSG